MIVQDGEVNRSWLREHGDENDRRSLPRVLDRLAHRNVVPRAVVDDIRLVRSERKLHRRAEVFFRRVDREVRAALLRLRKSPFRDIRDEHRLGAQPLRRLRDEDANRPRTENRYLCALEIRKATRRMHRDRKRLDHRALVETHLFAELSYFLRVHREILARHPCRLKTHHLQLFAEIVLPMTARMTLPADDLGLYRNFLADGESIDPCAKRCYLARDLVSLRHGILRERVLPVPHVYV